ncbi:MAG: TonB-dependent receptor plug domain-containing protein, partial [Endomicrobiales bacterium]
ENEVGLTRTQYGTLGAQSSVMFRGATAEQTLVMVDGRKINSISNGSANLSNLTLDSVERIEIIRGATSAVYGTNAFGGVVNIITKKKDETAPLVRFDSLYGNFNTQSYALNVNSVKGNGYGVFSAARNVSDGWRRNSMSAGNNVFARFGYDFGAVGQFDVSGSFFNNDLGVPGMLVGISPEKYDGVVEKGASTPDAKQNSTSKYMKIEHSKTWGEETLKTSLYASEDLLRYINPTWSENDDYASTVAGGDVQGTIRYGIVAGMEWWQEKHRKTDRNTGADIIDRSRVNTAAYLQKDVRINKLLVIPAVRLDNNSVFGSVVSPRITAVFRATDDLKISANSGKMWRAPTFNELYYKDSWGSSGNPLLMPEEGIASDIGVEYARDAFKGSVTLFHTQTKNLIQWQTDPLTWASTTENIGKTSQSGVEYELKHKLMSGLYGRLNYAYFWAVDTESGKELSYRPRNKANYTVSYMLPWNTTIDVTTQYVSSQKTGNTKIPELKEYVTLGFGVMHQISYMELWVKVNNATNTMYQTRLGYPLPGMTIAGGINIKI